MNNQPTIAPDNLIVKLQQLIRDRYMPCYSLKEATVTMTTGEIFTLLQRVYPTDLYKAHELAVWLEDWGFKLHETKPLRFEWLLKRI